MSSSNRYDTGSPVVLEVDDQTDSDFMDSDSAFGDDASLFSSTASLRSSLMRTSEENGRKYHGYKEGRYVLPIDEIELNRQTYQYNLCLATFGAYNYAPLKTPHRVLDVGCGLGFWAIDFAEAHPESQVIGVDLSPVQPEYVPPNVQFEIDDLEEPWTFTFNYDYIHVLMMTGAFRDWTNFYRQAFQFLNPGGYVEIQDIDFPLRCDDGSLPATSALRRWSDLLMEAGERSGFLLNTCGRAADLMRAAGFVDVVRVPLKWPLGPWPKMTEQKRLGWWVLENFDMGCETICLALFTRFLGWTKEDVIKFADEVKADMHNRAYHTYFNMYVTYGRKP